MKPIAFAARNGENFARADKRHDTPARSVCGCKAGAVTEVLCVRVQPPVAVHLQLIPAADFS